MNDRIVIDPKICQGQPIVRGTCTPASVILNALAEGDDCEKLEKEYAITVEDIRACMPLAAVEIEQVSSRPVMVMDMGRGERLRQLQCLFAEWNEEDSTLTDEDADRLRTALETSRRLSTCLALK